MQTGDVLKERCEALFVTTTSSNRAWGPSLVTESNRELLGKFDIADEVFGIRWDTEIQGRR